MYLSRRVRGANSNGVMCMCVCFGGGVVVEAG